jgi:hypothetical protein
MISPQDACASPNALHVEQTAPITVGTPNSGSPFTAPAPVRSFCTGVDSIPGAPLAPPLQVMFERDILPAGFVELVSKNTFLKQKVVHATVLGFLPVRYRFSFFDFLSDVYSSFLGNSM